MHVLLPCQQSRCSAHLMYPSAQVRTQFRSASSWRSDRHMMPQGVITLIQQLVPFRQPLDKVSELRDGISPGITCISYVTLSMRSKA
jgi:hypothetical protein